METKTKSCTIKLCPDRISEDGLRRFLEENRDLVLSPRERFHSTAHYSEEVPVFERRELIKRMRGYLPIILNPETYSYDVFGEDEILVLRYENSDVREINNLLISEAVRQMVVEWPDGLDEREFERLKESSFIRKGERYGFNPHITLARGFRGLVSQLPLFRDSVVFRTFQWVI